MFEVPSVQLVSQVRVGRPNAFESPREAACRTFSRKFLDGRSPGFALVTLPLPIQLDSHVGNDWGESSPGRVIRLLSEFPSAGNPKTATRYLAEQIEHQREHLDGIRAWMARV